MTGPPLQMLRPEFTQLEEYVLLGGNLVMLVLGLLIAYIAFRGYRRNRSRPMLFISVGFVLVLGGPFLLQGASVLLFPTVYKAIIFLSMGSQIIGLAVILYALWL